MKKIIPWMLCLFMSGCSIYSVSTDGANKGIPILVKRPVLYHQTKIAQTHWRVQFVLGEGEKKSPEVPVDIVASPDAYGLLEIIRLELANDKAVTPENFDEKVLARLRKEMAVFNGCGSALLVSTPPCVRGGEYAAILEDKAVVVSELSHEQYYINTKRPWIGSASATIKLAQDGTMTDAQSSVEDKTVETILSVVPVANYLTKQWSLGEKAPDTVTAAAEIGGLSTWVSDALNKAMQAKPAKPKNTVRVLIKETIDTYILRKEMIEIPCGEDDRFCEKGSRKMEALGPALEYPDCKDNRCVELFGMIRGGTEQNEEKKDKKGWTISGSVIPPESD
jgi:hypothetical protein